MGVGEDTEESGEASRAAGRAVRGGAQEKEA